MLEKRDGFYVFINVEALKAVGLLVLLVGTMVGFTVTVSPTFWPITMLTASVGLVVILTFVAGGLITIRTVGIKKL